MKIFLHTFLAFNALSVPVAADLVDDFAILPTRKMEKGSKKTPVVQPMPPPSPICPDVTKNNVFEGHHNPADDPNDPRYPDGTPVNYTNPFTPVDVPDGWVGGFEYSNPEFPYPTVNLSSLLLTSNMQNIAKLTRMQKVRWPEFSWEMVRGIAKTRVFITLSKFISRLGYDNTGRVWSLICPQLGVRTDVANFNMEVTVTGVRGWTSEPERISGIEMGALVQLWFTPTTSKGALSTAFRVLLALINDLTDLPLSKQKAIQVLVNNPGDPDESLFKINKGLDPKYNAPWFKVHWNEGAYSSGYLVAQVGKIRHRPSASQMTKDFSELVLALFNFGSGNMVKYKNILSWNLWQKSPELVNQTEWQNHADYWRESLNTNGTTPEGDISFPDFYYFDHSVVTPHTNPLFIGDQLYMIYKFIHNNFKEETISEQVKSMQVDGSLSCSEESEVRGQLYRAGFLADIDSQN